jgi:conjugal transfer pilus assembly protein TraV
MRNKFPTSLVAAALSSCLGLGACSVAAVNPCKNEYGGICVSPREVYGITRNRDQVNPTEAVAKTQAQAGHLINTAPQPADLLPSIHPARSVKAGPAQPGSDLPSVRMDESASDEPGQAGEVLGGAEGGDSGDGLPVQGHPYMTEKLGRADTPYPILRQPKVIRVWVAPYVGRDDNLHFPGFVYSVIQPKTWTFGYGSQRSAPVVPSPGQLTQPDQ